MHSLFPLPLSSLPPSPPSPPYLPFLPPSLPPRHTKEGLGDVIERLAPFLKLYAHYTSGFEDAMKLLTSWTKRDKKFDALVRDFEVRAAFISCCN